MLFIGSFPSQIILLNFKYDSDLPHSKRVFITFGKKFLHFTQSLLYVYNVVSVHYHCAQYFRHHHHFHLPSNFIGVIIFNRFVCFSWRMTTVSLTTSLPAFLTADGTIPSCSFDLQRPYLQEKVTNLYGTRDTLGHQPHGLLRSEQLCSLVCQNLFHSRHIYTFGLAAKGTSHRQSSCSCTFCTGVITFAIYLIFCSSEKEHHLFKVILFSHLLE